MPTLSMRGLPMPQPRQIFVALLALLILWGARALPGEMSLDARHALAAVALAMLGWIMTKLPEAWVALAAVVGLVLSGTLPEKALFDALGQELVWLLLAAFVIAEVLKEVGLTERLLAPLMRRRLRFDHFVLILTPAIAATAFVLPSTSGRAALLMPIFLALCTALPDPRLIKPLALVFPTVILLSAGGSLIGAGAHLLAVASIESATGLRLGYLDWALLGLPFALLTSCLGSLLILWLFAPADLRRQPLGQAQTRALTPDLRKRQTRVAMVVLALVGLWLTADLHGFGIALTAVAGALIVMTKPFTTRKSKEILRAVDLELLLYMAATILLAEAMIETGADRWLAQAALAALPSAWAASANVAVMFMAVIAVTAHLFVTSRSARAAVLIPAVALPLAGLGHDATLMILIAVMGTGFCQTMMASAKPVAIFANADTETFTQSDLFRLAIPLMPLVLALLVIFALCLWPAQIALLGAK